MIAKELTILAERIELGNVGWRRALVEGALRTHGMGHAHEVAHRLDDVDQHAARHVVRADRGEQQASQHSQQPAQHKAQEVARVGRQAHGAHRLRFMQYLLLHGTERHHAAGQALQAGKPLTGRALPLGQQPVVLVVDAGLGYLRRGNCYQRLVGGRLVAEHHRRF